MTVDVNYCESDLTNLLPASLFLKQTPSNAVGLRYLSGSEVTIVASKNTKRYRLQSNSLPVIGVTLEWLLDRLHRYYSAEKPPFAASFTPPLPLPEYFEVIERHYKVCMCECVCVCVCVCVCAYVCGFVGEVSLGFSEVASGPPLGYITQRCDSV